MSYSKTCVQCGAPFTSRRPEAETCSDECKGQRWIEKSLEAPEAPIVPVHGHPLDEVRALHEESKGRWTVVVREHLNRTLLDTGHVSAEDFDKLGIPAEHSNLANAQMGSYVARKSGKFWIYRITGLGREKLAGVGAGARASSAKEHAASVDSGENEDTSGVQRERAADDVAAVSGASLHPGGASPVGPSEKGSGSGDGVVGPSLSPESPAQLFPDEAEKPRPLSAFTDSEAA